ncbi:MULTISPECIES: hypothetical protein [Dinoroseobacter]|jgi:hypothetical protein|uniref:hypothetical protein n=1 Tax=Dinoroseobacter TaxID=309512 RepID=UPI0005C72153|nr:MULTISPECIES: hypothetical protein [Dinoroseobacter]MDD9715792.1 hypothetical protein [Dinoroseobacter sp. PD6]URF47658.1 hypothetical protein M8008_05060 [Dinoroseobacter shibae]URF51968.1 hypothetical protein M8007_05060 [Dinoroseobacter shibae]
MGREDPKEPVDKSVSARAARDARLKAALKANMQRRKAQARARQASTNEDAAPDDGSEQA